MLLEEAGIITKAFEKKRGNLLEAFFRPVASNLQIPPSLLTARDDDGEHAMLYQMAVAMVGALTSDLAVFDRVTADEVVLRHRQVTLPDEEASAMRAELTGGHRPL